MALTTVQSGMMDSIAQYNSFKNRIINGAMVIDQRNNGASVTNAAGGVYTLDRWNAFGSQASKYTIQQNAGSVTPPSGFKNYIGITSSSAYTVGASESFSIRQYIEGLNIYDLAWGTASAHTVTLSFWVRSSLTGSFGGCVYNGTTDRFYPFTYTISAANTWEKESVTIAGDTSGTWATTNGLGLAVQFSLGAGSSLSGTAGAWTGTGTLQPTGSTSVVGTSGATFYVTGVQLEKGSTATAFDYRPYELQLCQRYYYKTFPGAINIQLGTSGWVVNSTTAAIAGGFPVTMRIAPTAIEQSGTANQYMVAYAATSAQCTSVPTFTPVIGKDNWTAIFTTGAVLTAGQSIQARTDAANGAAAYLAWSAEI
jgi:hypothetical protein